MDPQPSTRSGNDKDAEWFNSLSQKQIIEMAGNKLQDKINADLFEFAEVTKNVLHAASSDATLHKFALEQVTNSTQQLQVQVQDSIFEFTEHVTSVGEIEADFNERAKLLLQCHTMSSYITACLMEKYQKLKHN